MGSGCSSAKQTVRNILGIPFDPPPVGTYVFARDHPTYMDKTWDQAVTTFGIVTNKKDGKDCINLFHPRGGKIDGTGDHTSVFNQCCLTEDGDPIAQEAYKNDFKVEVHWVNDGSNKFDEIKPCGPKNDPEASLDGWHVGYLRFRKFEDKKLWYCVALMKCEHPESPEFDLRPYPGPEPFGRRVHSSYGVMRFAGEAIRAYTGKSEHGELPINAGRLHCGAAAFHVQGQADLAAHKAARSGDKNQAAIAAERNTKAAELRAQAS